MPDDDCAEADDRTQVHIEIRPASDWAVFADAINRGRGWPVS